MPKLRNYDPLAKLEKAQKKAVRELLAQLQRTREALSGRIALAATKRDIASNARRRSELFEDVVAELHALAGEMDVEIRNLMREAGLLGHEATIADLREAKAKLKLLRYDQARNERYFDLVRPANGRSLAATFTGKMGETGIRQLRTAVVEALRQAQVEGLTANGTQKLLQAKWDELAGNQNAFRFVDRSGRPWEEARYLQMVVRTTAQRVAVESQIDTLTGNGYRFGRISDDGDKDCPVCVAWEGKIILLVGQSRQFPTYAEAKAAGVWHPNCTHRLEYIDEDEVKRGG